MASSNCSYTHIGEAVDMEIRDQVPEAIDMQHRPHHTRLPMRCGSVKTRLKMIVDQLAEGGRPGAVGQMRRGRSKDVPAMKGAADRVSGNTSRCDRTRLVRQLANRPSPARHCPAR